MTAYQIIMISLNAMSLMIAFGKLIIALLTYIKDSSQNKK